MVFSRFLEQRYLEWQIIQGERKTIAEFSGHLGFPPTTVSSWLGGKRKPRDQGELIKLAERLGFEVYDVLELPRPNENLFHIQQHWEGVPLEKQRAIAEEVEGYATGKKPKRSRKPKSP